MLITTGGAPDEATSAVQIATGGSAQLGLVQMALRPRATVRGATNCPIATKGVARADEGTEARGGHQVALTR
jgi:hypothetical protein